MPATASAASLVTRTSRVEHGAPGRPFRVGSDGLPLLPCHESPSSLVFLSAEPLPPTTSHFGSVATREDVRAELETRYRQSQQLPHLSEATLRIDTELELLRRSCFAQRNAQWGDVAPDQFEFRPVPNSTWTPQPANTKLLLRKMRMEGALEGREFFPPEQKTEDALEFVRDRPWPPRELALKPVTKPSRGRGGKRKAAPMAAVMDPVPLLAKTCRECRTQSTPLWRTQTRSVKVKKPVVENAATSLANAFVAQGMAQIAPQTVKMQEVEEQVEVDLCLKCYLKLERADLFDKKRVEKRRQERRKKEQVAAAAQLEKKRLKHQIHLLKKQQKEHKKKELLAMQDGVGSETLAEREQGESAAPAAVILKFTREEIEAATAPSKERKRDRKHSRRDKKKKKKHRRRHEVLEDSEDEDPNPIPSPAQMNGFLYADLAPEPSSTPQTSAFEVEQANPTRYAEAMTIDTTGKAVDGGLGSQVFGYEEAASTPARSSSRKRKSVQRTDLGVLVESHTSSLKKRMGSPSSAQTPRSRRAGESVAPAPAVVAVLPPPSMKKRARTKKELARERELRALGQYCPVCNEVYEDDDQSTFVCCDSCELWVHGACDPSLTPYVVAFRYGTFACCHRLTSVSFLCAARSSQPWPTPTTSTSARCVVDGECLRSMRHSSVVLGSPT
jgi:hypothetical protein